MKRHFLSLLLLLFYGIAHAQWQNVGTEGFSAGIAANPVITTAPDGTPYVAYTDLANNAKLSVMRYTGGSWQYIGAPGFTADTATFPALAVDAGGTPYVCFSDKSTGRKLTVMKYAAGSWSTVGTAGFSAAAITTAAPVICVNSSGTPYIAYHVSGPIVVQQFTGAGWATLASPTLSQDAFGWDLCINKITNEPLLLFSDDYNSYGSKATVQRYNGSSWVLLGNRAFSSGMYGVYYADIETDANGNIYAALQDDDGPEKAAVYKLNGSTWVSVGPKYISAGHTYNNRLALSSSGVPYIIYSDVNNSLRPNFNSTVLRYNGTTWQPVGAAGFLRENSISGIAIAADGLPYVVNVTTTGKAKVVKYVDSPVPTIKPTSQYTFVVGDSAQPFKMSSAGVGVSATTNTPGGRYFTNATHNSSGTSYWVFGGYGYTSSYPSYEYLNDLWQYQTSTGSWTLMSANRTDNKSIYGTKGTATATNTPGKRYGQVIWTDLSDNVWLFGGIGYDASGSLGSLNDLWKYNIGTSQWVWLSGDSNINKNTIYGTQGVANTTNKPGGRLYPGSFSDLSGNLWLYGGNGYTGTGTTGYLSDLWKYNITTNQWAWIGGDTIINVSAVPGTQGVATATNKPGYKYRPVMAPDASGNVWMFSGISSGAGNLVWRYQISTNVWTWMKGNNEIYSVYGTKGIAATANTPGNRVYCSGDMDASGNLWIFGGNGYGINETQFQSTGYLNTNDLWKYNTLTNQWTWVSGDNIMFQHGIYGTKGIAATTNKPGGSLYSMAAIMGGEFYTFGGLSLTKSGGFDAINTFIKYNPATNAWTWLKGDNFSLSAYHGIAGVGTAETRPSARSGHMSMPGNDGSLYLFGGNTTGGFNAGSGLNNDLWKYNPSTGYWTFIKGSTSVGYQGIYGTQGVPTTTTQPSSRQQSASWKDASGNLWVFGGLGNSNTYLNDLWKYDIATGNWTWVNGSSSTYQPGVYGTVGVAAAINKPGCRYGAYNWADTSGNLWMYGGQGQGTNGAGYGALNDLWKYNIVTNLWTFVKGDSTPNKAGIYGDTLDIYTNTNRPGSRAQGVSWVDNAGNLCLFAGNGYGSTTAITGNLADIWKYNPNTNTWVWMRGAKIPNPFGIYGTAGVYDKGNNPGGRWGSSYSADQYGNLILFGGFGLTGNGGYDFMNDLWKYDNATNTWAYMKGQPNYGPTGIYSRETGISSATASVGGRYLSGMWADNVSGKVYLYGGAGYTSNSADGFGATQNDLWKLDQDLVILPLKITRFTARLSSADVLCNWVTTEEFNLRNFEVERSLNGSDFTKIGTVAAANSYTTYSYNFTDAGAAKLNSAVLYYRLKSIDKDGKYVYSGIVMIRLQQSAAAAIATLYPNPVKAISYLSIEATTPQTITIKATSTSGQQLFTRQVTIAAGSNSIPVDCSNLPTGTYLLQIIGANTNYAPIKFLKTGNQ